ncbi:hypothetical protein [Paraburkholderia kururiensis]|uniref:hypothetical protein n=1 Tax=Paraburkholderia kururiensis TaxID=984307 RepID=UPI000694CCE7|nr:hypothetical protein [Paraburkholderia kururiensis]
MQVSGSGGGAVDPAFYRAASAKQGGAGKQTDAAARVGSADTANAGGSGADAPASSETGVKVRLGEPERRADDSPLYGATGRLASETPAASTQDANAQVGSPPASGEAGHAAVSGVDNGADDQADNEAAADPQRGDAQTTRAASTHDLPASQSADASADGSTDPSTDPSTGKQAQSSSPIKSFTYGTLGLESPEQQSEQKDSYYSAGRWLAAAVTVGGIISLIL